MRSRILLVATALLLTATASFAHLRAPLQPPVYLIRGYLDRAPAKTKVIDRVDITAPGKPTRWLLVTFYQAPGGVLLDRYLSQQLKHPWVVRGKRQEVARLLESPAGTKIEGKFVVYTRGYPAIMIAELDRPS